MKKVFLALTFVASIALPVSSFAGAAEGKQASQCFAMYKIAEGMPANASHRGDFQKLESFMQGIMQKNNVTQKQFVTWTDEMRSKFGSNKKPDVKAMGAQVQTCNAFAKAQYDALAAAKNK